METILLIATISILNIACFFIGAKVGQKVVNNEPLEVPTPTKMYEEYKEHVETKKQQEEAALNLENINNYKGDSIGQKDI